MNRRGISIGAALLGAAVLARDLALDDVPEQAEPAESAPRASPGLAGPVVPAAPRSRGLFYAGVGTGPAGLALAVGGIATHDDKTLAECKTLSKAGLVFSAGDCAILGLGTAMGRTTQDLVSVGGGAVLAVGATMAIVGVWQPPPVSSARPPRASSHPADVARLVF